MLCLNVESSCQCSGEYDSPLHRSMEHFRIEAYCYDWHLYGDLYCNLKGGLAAYNCPGAQRDVLGEFYWTDHPDVCLEAEDKAIGKILTVLVF